jgi:hypothetical protein
MSARNPMNAMFEMQRSMIKSGQTAVESSMKLQRAASSAFVESLDTTKSVQKSGVALSKQAWNAYFDALEGALPAETLDEARSVVDEQYQVLDEAHDEAWESYEAALRESLDSYDELTDAQVEMMHETFDALLEASEEAESMAQQTAESVEQVGESVEQA